MTAQMTTAYTERAPQVQALPAGGHLKLVHSSTAPAQGKEAMKVRDVVRTFGRGTAARGQSAESAKVIATMKQLQLEMAEHVDSLRAMIQGREELSYDHVPVKPAFTVQATYKFIGKLKPRQFPLDE